MEEGVDNSQEFPSQNEILITDAQANKLKARLLASLCVSQRLINTRLQWNFCRIRLDPDPRITKEFNMINALNSKQCQNDLPLITKKDCQIA